MAYGARALWFGLAVSWLGLAGCHYQGSGTALLRAPTPSEPGGMKSQGQIVFKWQSRGDSSNGQIQAALPDGRRFSGTFVQPTTTDWNSNYSPYYNSWSGPWGMNRPWYGGPRSSFAVQYSGKALAHLDGPDGSRMRCEFSLFRPN
ncbi:MAG: hypothetical protein JWN04_4513, partial [Myxococcaceae bacterium]|nr:hypothetical protein [Myxococcaceae bacterium]